MLLEMCDVEEYDVEVERVAPAGALTEEDQHDEIADILRSPSCEGRGL